VIQVRRYGGDVGILQRFKGRPQWQDSGTIGNRASPPFGRLPERQHKLILIRDEMQQGLSTTMLVATIQPLAKHQPDNPYVRVPLPS